MSSQLEGVFGVDLDQKSKQYGSECSERKQQQGHEADSLGDRCSLCRFRVVPVDTIGRMRHGRGKQLT